MKSLVILSTLLSLLSIADTNNYKCYSVSKDGFLTGGFAILKIEKKSSVLEIYDINSITKKTSKISIFKFDLSGKMNGSSAVAGYIKSSIDYQKSKYMGDPMTEIYFEETLFNGGYPLKKGGTGGFLVFTGHGYSWDRNICIKN